MPPTKLDPEQSKQRGHHHDAGIQLPCTLSMEMQQVEQSAPYAATGTAMPKQACPQAKYRATFYAIERHQQQKQRGRQQCPA